MYTIDKEKFAAFVQQLRKEKGYTQRTLAEKLLISDKAVSKWETGTSIPDTALLVPLSELLGVSATELLLCERMEAQERLEPQTVEDIVKTAFSYSEEAPARNYPGKGKWAVGYAIALLLGLLGVYACWRQGAVSSSVLTAAVLGLGFGLYFCFFANTRLPDYYDAHNIHGVMDGAVRLNVPGLRFSNRNWPYILRVGRIWSLCAGGLYPLLSALALRFLGERWLGVEPKCGLALLLMGLLVPLLVVGRKYQ